MTLKFNRVIAVVAVHVCAKFHQAMCSGSRIIMKTTKGIKKLSNDAENNTVVATANSNDVQIKPSEQQQQAVLWYKNAAHTLAAYHRLAVTNNKTKSPGMSLTSRLAFFKAKTRQVDLEKKKKPISK